MYSTAQYTFRVPGAEVGSLTLRRYYSLKKRHQEEIETLDKLHAQTPWIIANSKRDTAQHPEPLPIEQFLQFTRTPSPKAQENDDWRVERERLRAYTRAKQNQERKRRK